MAVYFAVMAPLFWAPEFVQTPEQLARILWILLICSGVQRRRRRAAGLRSRPLAAGGVLARDHRDRTRSRWAR